MRIGWGAAAEKAQRFAGGDGVPGTRRDEDGIAGADGARLAVDLHFALALEDEIKLLCEPVVMPLRGRAGGDLRLGEALLFDRGIGAVEDAADGRAVLGGEGFLVGEAEHVKTSLLHTLLEEGIIPVIAPVATGEGGTSLNLNADTMADLREKAVKAQKRVEMASKPVRAAGELTRKVARTPVGVAVGAAAGRQETEANRNAFLTDALGRSYDVKGNAMAR